ncbi:MAG: hypothetical protein ABEK03_03800 [Candidatus Bipolaricaulia bacterium]
MGVHKLRPLPVGLLCCIVLSMAFWSGCDNSVNILDRETGLYSIHGALDMYREVNHIRVKALNAPLVADSTRTLDATVTLEDLQTGTTEMLTDSVVRFENVYTHNFRVTTDIRPDTKYRVTVEHPDGRTAQATATTPVIAEQTVSPKTVGCRDFVLIAFEPVASSARIDPVVAAEYGGSRNSTSELRPRRSQSSPDRVFLRFTPQQALNAIFGEENPPSLEPKVRCDQLDTNRLYVRYAHLGPDFSGDTPSDSLDLTGEIGQFGGFYRDSLSVRIDTTSQ